MDGQILRHRRVLLVEDEYVIAVDLCAELTSEGAEVVGPVSSVDAALSILKSGAQMDLAVLDINLRGKMVYPVADLLAGRSIPFIFATGYDGIAIPRRFGSVPCCEKPVSIASLRRAVARALQAS
ncbi:response regulator [Frigidibacter sp. SD6-1]|uniref:response regulator n=1 Tax=Frigidibacter sp. SD6-1 TaxID=3032581 RepID=UPI0024DFD496|nr:response regulator [Frigidibacter sp. SD6-1]